MKIRIKTYGFHKINFNGTSAIVMLHSVTRMLLILLWVVLLETKFSNALTIDPGGTFHIRKYNEFYWKFYAILRQTIIVVYTILQLKDCMLRQDISEISRFLCLGSNYGDILYLSCLPSNLIFVIHVFLVIRNRCRPHIIIINLCNHLKFMSFERFYLNRIGCFTSHATIFQFYMWRQIDGQAEWRRSWTCGRAPFNVPVQAPTRDKRFYTLFRETAPFSHLLRHAGDAEDTF